MHNKDQGNRAAFRNMMFIFQKKHAIESVNNFPKLHNAVADAGRKQGLNYCFMTPGEFNNLVLATLADSVIVPTQKTILKDWGSFFKTCYKPQESKHDYA